MIASRSSFLVAHRCRSNTFARHAEQRIPGDIFWTSPLGYKYSVNRERTHAIE